MQVKDHEARQEVSSMKGTALRIITAGAGAVLVGVVMAAGSSSMPVRADVTIRHTVVGCYDWSVSGGSFATAHTLVLSEGQVLTVRNRDECGILLEQTAGPVRALAVGKVAEPLGKPVVVPLHTPGVYEFTGTDYEAADLVAEPGTEWGLSRVASTGADNVLTLTVRVLPSRAPAE